MPSATYRHGDPVMIDYTPAAGAVTAGDIILVGNTAGLTNVIVHTDIANNVLGSVACGNGIYSVKVLSNYASGTKVYWDATNSVLTSTSTNMSQFGYTVEASAAANSTIKVLHSPRA